MDEQRLAELFRQARAADAMRVPPMRTIIARVEHAKELQARRRFTIVVQLLSGLITGGACAAILLAPGAFPLPMSPWIVPLLALGGLVFLWGTGVSPLADRAETPRPPRPT